MLRKLSTKKAGFTLVEIMIVVAIIALLASIAVPNFLRSRLRSQATQVLEDLRQIDSAIDQYAIEKNKKSTDNVAWNDVKAYIKAGTRLANSNGKDLFGTNDYSLTTIANGVKLHNDTRGLFNDVTDNTFWSPFAHY